MKAKNKKKRNYFRISPGQIYFDQIISLFIRYRITYYSFCQFQSQSFFSPIRSTKKKPGKKQKKSGETSFDRAKIDTLPTLQKKNEGDEENSSISSSNIRVCAQSLFSYFLVILLMVFHQSVRNRSFSLWGIVVIHTRSCWGDRHCVFFIDIHCSISKKENTEKKARESIIQHQSTICPIARWMDFDSFARFFLLPFLSLSLFAFFSFSLRLYLQ